MVWVAAILAFSAALFGGWWSTWLGRSSGSVVLALALAWVSPALDLPLAQALLGAAGLCLGWKYASRPRALFGPDLSRLERVGLLVSGLAGLWRPGWLAVQLVLVSYRRRLVPPSLHERLAIHLEVVLVAFLLLRQACGGGPVQSEAGLALQLCLLATVAALYLRPGYAKLFKGKRWWHWITRVGLHYQLLGSYAWGWLPGLSASDFARAVRWLRPFNVPMAALVVILELSTLALPWKAGLAQVVLLGLAGFHLAYLALTGACFWENMLLLLAAALAVPQLPPAFFGIPAALLFAPATLALVKIFDTSPLTWWELPLVQKISTQVIVDGEAQHLGHICLDPHERLFYIGFSELSPQRLLTHNLSHTDLEQAEVELILSSSQTIENLRKFSPVQALNEEELESVRLLLRQVVLGLENHSLQQRRLWWQAPRSYWARGSRRELYEGSSPIEEILLIYQEFFWIDGRILETPERIIASFQRSNDEEVLKYRG